MSDDDGHESPLDRALEAVWHVEEEPKTLLAPMVELRPKYRRRRQHIARSTELNEAVEVALRLGAVFLAGGAPTDHVESAVFAAGTALGLEPFEVDITSNAITLSVPPGPKRPGVTMLRVVRSRAKHHARLAAAHELVLDLTGGRITKDQLLERLGAIERMPRPYPRWFVTLAWGVLAGSLVLRLGGGFLASVIAFVSAAIVDRVGRVLNRRGAPDLFINATGALIATTVAVLMTSLQVPARSSLVVAGGIIALLPGMALVVAAQEAMGAFPVTAAARLVEVSVGTAGIVAGVLGGLLIAGQLGVVMEVTELDPDTLGSLLLAVGAGGTAAAASAVGSHAPARVLISAGLAGAVGIVVVKAVAAAGIATNGVAEGVAGVVVGALGTWLAARHRVPAVLLVVPGVIPMLPGLASYQGLLEISQGDLPLGAETLFGALTVALAIAGGVLLGELFLSGITRRRGHGVPVGAGGGGASATVVGMLAPSGTRAPSRDAGPSVGSSGTHEARRSGAARPPSPSGGTRDQVNRPKPDPSAAPVRRPILRGDPDPPPGP